MSSHGGGFEELIESRYDIHVCISKLQFGLFYSNLVEILDSHLDFRIGSTELKHCFDHPECGKNRTRYRDSLPLNAYRFENPERFKQRLEGLGIRLVEEISILWVLGYCSAYFAVITVFGVVWWICKGDISGGFTAASFFGSILTCVTIALTIFISSKSQAGREAAVQWVFVSYTNQLNLSKWIGQSLQNGSEIGLRRSDVFFGLKLAFLGTVVLLIVSLGA